MNFKYPIGLFTNKGIIKSRYYAEWKNRNGGDCNGDFYIMKDGGSFSEMLVEAKEKSICKKCNGFAIPSKGFGNTYGEPDEVGKKTIYEGSGTLVDCLKCVDCGHSWN